MTTIDLTGRTILITRPQPGADETARQVAHGGGIPLLAPVLRLLPAEDMRPFAAAMARLNEFDGVLLTSANSAKAFVEAMPDHATPPPLFAVGKKTAHILEQRGWRVTVPDQPEGGEALGQTILEWHPQGKRFLFPRAEEGREELITLLEGAGRAVTTITVYRTAPVLSLPDAVLQQWPGIDAIPFFSPRTVEAFVHALPGDHTSSLPPRAVIAALSPLTAHTLRQHGIPPQVVATRADSEGILQALTDYWRSPTSASRINRAT